MSPQHEVQLETDSTVIDLRGARRPSTLQLRASALIAVLVGVGGLVCLFSGLLGLGVITIGMACGAGLRVFGMRGNRPVIQKVGTAGLGLGALVFAIAAVESRFFGPALVAAIGSLFSLAELTQTGSRAASDRDEAVLVLD